MIVAMAVWISGWTIAETANPLLTWFDKYSTSTDQEGDMKKSPFTRDADGTSIIFDLLYQSITAAYAPMVLSVIMMGGYFFAAFVVFMYGFGDPLENCDLSNVNSSDYSSNGELFVDGIIPNLNQGTLKECQANMKLLFKAIDVKNDGFIDKCDDAKFLKASGASDEYALTFGGTGSLYELTQYCYAIVPGADMEKPDEFMDLVYWFLHMFMGGHEKNHDHEDNDNDAEI